MERLSSSKWTATVASIWIQRAASSSYAFDIYSSALKSSQGYDQPTFDMVSVFKDIGANVGVLSGILYAVVALSHRRIDEPWVVHAARVIQCFFRYFFLWAAVTGLVERPLVTVVCFFMFLAAHAQTFYNIANVVTGVHNFSEYGGTIVGIMKTLKATQGYDQSILDTVSVFKDFGAKCGVISGILYLYVATWHVLWWVLLARGAQCFLGYFLMWAALVGVIPRAPVGDVLLQVRGGLWYVFL